MKMLIGPSLVTASQSDPEFDRAELKCLEARLPPLLSVIAGMVDLTGFLTLGHIFTAHVTGNLVVAAVALSGGGTVALAASLSIAAFMVALAGVWVIARVSERRGANLARLLLWLQFWAIAAILIFSVITRPSEDPRGVAADVAVMIAASAMACQYALLRLAMPGAISTATMTGNLTSMILSLMEALPARCYPLLPVDPGRFAKSSKLLGGFLLGCALSSMTASILNDWVWSLPLAISAWAIVMAAPKRSRS
jgi:uncharacterized membrane protein YoaK (UPF0700 family)